MLEEGAQQLALISLLRGSARAGKGCSFRRRPALVDKGRESGLRVQEAGRDDSDDRTAVRNGQVAIV